MGDEKLLLHILNSTLEAFKRVNNLPDLNVNISLKDKDDPNLALAERDERITKMGYRPTQDYIQRTYNIQVEPIAEQTHIIPNSLKKLYALSATKPITSTDELSDRVDLQKIALSFQTQILDIVDSAKTFDEALDALYKAYPTLDLSSLQDALDTAMQSSYILGTAEVEFESEEEV
jgi:phage gp29-like protein